VTALVRLYPRAWRDRYEAEFLDVLADRPPSLTDRLDILLAAVDAHLEPEVPGETARERPRRTPSTRGRIGGGLAGLGGLLWAAAGIALVTAAFGVDGYRDTTPALLLSLFAGASIGTAMLVCADEMRGDRRLALALGSISLVGTLLIPVPWPAMVIGLFAIWGASAFFGGILMHNGARVVGGVLVAGSILAFATNTENAQAALLIPLGLAWLVVGGSMLAGLGWVTRADLEEG
jgi:hypothetical protein